MTVRHRHMGGDVSEFDAHSLYGHAEAVVTRQALRNVTGRRPFLLTRCCLLFTAAGHALVEGEWTHP